MSNEPGSLRIGKPPRSGQSNLEAVPGSSSDHGTADSANGQSSAPDKPYLARLVLLVPAEVISLYVAMKQAAQNFLPQFGVVCLLLVILVRMKATTGPDGRAEWISVTLSTLSFGLWIYSIGGSLPWLPPPTDPGVISVAIGVWTFAVPYFYKGSPPSNT